MVRGKNERNNDEAKIWEPPKDELERSVADPFDDECCDRSRFNTPCFFGKSSEDANLKYLEQPVMQEELDSKFKIIVSNLLESGAVSSSSSHWVEIIAKLSWEAAQILNSFISRKPIDPNAYVKVKCIATGSCNESKVFKGLVFTKHAAHKHMETKYEHPRILLVKGELGQCSSDLSSFKRMFQSEKLPNQMLLWSVEKSVSHDILMRILRRELTLVSDLNFQRLQRISSCFGTPIVPSDSLLSHNLKHCHSFRIESPLEEHNVAGEIGKKKSKSLMFLEGCPTSLGCTILLKGSDSDELKRVKKVAEYSVTLAYHLILETSFLVDQQEMLFSTPQLQEYVSDAIKRSSGFSSPSLPKYCGRLADQNAKTRDLDESIRICLEDRKHELLFDPRLLINKNMDEDTGLAWILRRNARSGIYCDPIPSHFGNITCYKNVDATLEKFLRNLFNRANRCNACEEFPQAHFYYYELRKIQLRIQLKRLPVGKHLPGEANGNIWMWSRRGEHDVSKKVLISNAACNLSIGKFLDLSVSQQTLLDKMSTSGHSLLQFFVFGYMVDMFSYSQVATYTAVMPPLKLEVGISLRVSWLEKEFQSVITKRTLMLDEVTNFVKQLRSKKKNSGLSLSTIEEISQEERSGFEENIKNFFEKAKTKLLSLNRIRWELFLQALVWNYRLYSLVLQVGYIDLIEVSSEQYRDASVIDYSKDDQTSVSNWPYIEKWFWISFEELRSKSVVEIEKEYMFKFKTVGKCFQENLDIVNKIIVEEGSRLHLSLGDDHYFVVSKTSSQV
ncbi:unnamed protein product [Arabis nemorensis]|uniref:Uncharacterized protein n=1 Tax=Arabis nemorensis TaxID=586526 RepID=A0A565C4Q7_9BRAS|nr:unnamed protein product [Arabis nemorensis]